MYLCHLHFNLSPIFPDPKPHPNIQYFLCYQKLYLQDVTVTLSSPDLASILEGTLAPLQAYLTGRISASGDMRKLMLFDKLSKRGHTKGTMFSV